MLLLEIPVRHLFPPIVFENIRSASVFSDARLRYAPVFHKLLVCACRIYRIETADGGDGRLSHNFYSAKGAGATDFKVRSSMCCVHVGNTSALFLEFSLRFDFCFQDLYPGPSSPSPLESAPSLSPSRRQPARNASRRSGAAGGFRSYESLVSKSMSPKFVSILPTTLLCACRTSPRAASCPRTTTRTWS